MSHNNIIMRASGMNKYYFLIIITYIVNILLFMLHINNSNYTEAIGVYYILLIAAITLLYIIYGRVEENIEENTIDIVIK